VFVATTIRDVAKAAGVSIATVSRALRGHPAISAKTTQHVIEVATELNYDFTARLSASNPKPVRIAVVLPFIGRWYFAKIVEGIERVLFERGYETVLLRPRDPVGQPLSIAEHLDLYGVEGAILVSLSPDKDDFDALLRRQIPAVLIDISEPRFTQVRIDNLAVGKQAAEHLTGLGHKRIAVVSGDPNDPLNFSTPNERLHGFRVTALKSGLRPDDLIHVHADFTAKSADLAITPHLESENRPTAVFAASDEMAFGVISAARRMGIRVPEDLSVIGVDDHELADSFGLTTIAQPIDMVAEVSAWQLMSRMNSDTAPEITTVTLPVTLIDRHTTMRTGALDA
jgi:DNA-binding LacI/PurR family transcriptional regulator